MYINGADMLVTPDYQYDSLPHDDVVIKIFIFLFDYSVLFTLQPSKRTKRVVIYYLHLCSYIMSFTNEINYILGARKVGVMLSQQLLSLEYQPLLLVLHLLSMMVTVLNIFLQIFYRLKEIILVLILTNLI